MNGSVPYDFAELVYRKVESDTLDYKAAMSWRSMSRREKGKIVRHLTAFANTNGGFLVIGVAENASGVPCDYTGVTEEQAGSFDPTPVGNFINSHIEPPLDFSIERPEIDGRYYVIFVVRPFKNLPHVCARGVEGELNEGMFYIRTAEASSRPARRAFELQELLRRCMRNEREQLARVLRGILIESGFSGEMENSRSQMQEAVLDAERYFRHRRCSGDDGVLLKFIVIPDRDFSIPADEMSNVLKKSMPKEETIGFFSDKSVSASADTPGSIRFLAQDLPRMWQFFSSGLFCAFYYFKSSDVSLNELRNLCTQAVCFSGKLGKKLNVPEAVFMLKFSLIPAKNMTLDKNPAIMPGEISADINRTAGDIVRHTADHASRILRRIGEQFRLPDKILDKCKNEIFRDLEVK